MIHYVIFYELSGDCKCREKNIIENITSYPGSIKMFNNTYFIQTFQDNQTLYDNLSSGLDDNDKMVIAQVDNITGKRVPNV